MNRETRKTFKAVQKVALAHLKELGDEAVADGDSRDWTDKIAENVKVAKTFEELFDALSPLEEESSLAVFLDMIK